MNLHILLILEMVFLIHSSFAFEDDSNSAAAVLLSQYAARLQVLEDGVDGNKAEIESMKTSQGSLESKINKSLIDLMNKWALTSTTLPPATTRATTSTTTARTTTEPITQVTQAPISLTRWNIIGDSKWAMNCDFVGGDIGSQRSTGEECGGICWNRADCSHFTWTKYQGGTCFLKGDGVSPVEVPKYTDGAVCGQVRMSGSSGSGWNRSGNVEWYSNCDFVGGDISNKRSTGEECGGHCERLRTCTHFTWTDWNGGTCFLKGAGVNPRAVFKSTGNTVCGWVNR